MIRMFNMTMVEAAAARDLHTVRVFYTSMERFHTMLVLMLAMLVPLIILLILIMLFKLHVMRRRVLPAVRLQEENLIDQMDVVGSWTKDMIIKMPEDC